MSLESIAPQVFPAYGVDTIGLDIKELQIKQATLKDDNLLLKVLYCGVCMSDVHQMNGAWRGLGTNIIDGNDGLVCGHEAISVVIGMGKKIDRNVWSIGDIVGCGPQRDCQCNKLAQLSTDADKFEQCFCCDNKQEQLCLNGIEKLYSREFTGGFGSVLHCAEKFCFKIPQGMDLLRTAPLCCAGLTTFSPLQRACNNNTIPDNATIGVIGIGGLGLMALQYALKMTDKIKHVYAFTTSKQSKEETLLKLGCDGVIDYKNEDLSLYKNKFDLIINTVSQDIDATLFMSMIKPLGELCYLGLGSNNISVNPFSMIANKRVSASFIGGTQSFIDMLNFSHQNDIYPICESVKVPFNNTPESNAKIVADAIKRVDEGKVRYRMVLDYCVDVDAVVKVAKEIDTATQAQ